MKPALPRELRQVEAEWEQCPARSPERELAAWVLRAAVTDLRAGLDGATRFFESKASYLNFWCMIVDIDPDEYRWRALDMATATRAPRKQGKPKKRKSRDR